MLINLAAGRSSSGTEECCPPVVNPFVLVALIGGNLNFALSSVNLQPNNPNHKRKYIRGYFWCFFNNCTLTSGIALATYFLRQAMLINITKRKRKRSVDTEDSPGQIQMGESNY